MKGMFTMWRNDKGRRICPECGAPVVSTTACACVNAYCERCGWHTANITDEQMRDLQEFARKIEEREAAHP